MDATPDLEQTHAPYGPIGLCLSLVVIALLGAVGTAAILACATLLAAAADGAAATAAFLREAPGLLLQGESVAGERLLFGISLALYAAVALAILSLARWRGGAAWRELIAWYPPVWQRKDKAMWAIVAGALVYSFAASAALGYVNPHAQSWFTVPADRTAATMLFALAVIFAPIAEDLLFRGWIYTGLRFHWGVWPALLISSALFALAHYDATHLYSLAVFPLGLALAAIRERSGSVKASILFHACNNLIAFCAAAVAGG